MSKTPEQRLLELEQENRLLKKQKRTLEKQVEQADKKAIIFDMMIDLAEKEYNIPIRKNSSPGGHGKYGPHGTTAHRHKKTIPFIEGRP